MLASRREFLAGVAAAGLASDAGCAAAGDVLTPEAFGAKGDGRTNDSAAFAALSEHVNARGGGTIALRPVTYIVGGHVAPNEKVHNERTARFAFPPAAVLRLVNCTGDVVVRGNGAILRAAAGLRYGYFDPRTGRPFKPGKPTELNFAASPYVAMIHAEDCSGLIDISDVELDGNLPRLQIGAEVGKGGLQLASTGIRLANNSGPQRLSRVYSHHHPLDGLTVYRPVEHSSLVTFKDLLCEYNGRQGCSITGGRNYSFERCRFLHTGKGGLRSAPSAGVDIEAGRHPIRNVSFSACEFSNNAGAGLISHSGDVEGATFDDCRFIGTTSRSVWPNKPRFRFDRCLLVGSLIRAHGDSDPAKAAQFHDCRFSDDPALSPTGQVFGGRGRRRLIAQLPNSPNVLFNRCKFELEHEFLLPQSTRAVIYSDCEMSQRAPARSRPKGTYVGVNRLNGNVDLEGSIIRGTVILNGRTVPRRS